MIYAFTGSRRPGLTLAQIGFINSRIPSPKRLLHGGAIGADTQADLLFGEGRGCPIEVYPASKDRFDFWVGKSNRVVHPPQDPIARNHIMVNRCDLLIACPGTMHEIQRSGTWATIRYGRRQGKPTLLVFPDGSCQTYGLGVEV